MDNEVLIRLSKIEGLIKENNLSQKTILNLSEASIYFGISESLLYKLTSGSKVPFYKPNGKLIFFKREELESWVLSQRFASGDEIASKASNFTFKKGGQS